MKKVFLFYIAATLVAIACQNPKTSDFSFKEYDLPQIDTTRAPGDTSANKLNDPHGAQRVGGFAAKYWGRAMKHCMQSVLLKPGEVDYVGPGNTLGLGTMTDENRELTHWVIDTSIFSANELKSIINPGVPTTCNYVFSGNIDLESLFNTEFRVKDDYALSAEMSNTIKSNRNIDLNISKWQKDELLIGPLKLALKEEGTQQRKAFKEDLLKEGRILMTRAIRIKGFSAMIDLNSTLSASLKAKLDSGLVVNIGDTKGEIKAQLVNSRKIKLESDGDFIVYGKFVKASKIF